MNVKIQKDIEVKPFTVPNFIVEVGDGDCAYDLSMFDSCYLNNMCEEFRVAVFKKAGKAVPPQP